MLSGYGIGSGQLPDADKYTYKHKKQSGYKESASKRVRKRVNSFVMGLLNDARS